MSGDGRTVVGQDLRNVFDQATVWHFPDWNLNWQGTFDGSTVSTARAADFDGGVTVGQSGAGTLHEYQSAYRQTGSDPMVDLGLLNGFTNSTANAINDDGSVVAGYGYQSDYSAAHGFRWTLANGMTDLGALFGDTRSQANGIDGDGNKIVGQSDNGIVAHAFIWTPGGGMQGISLLAGATSGGAQAISRDGNVVVGTTTMSDGHAHAYAWTAAGGAIDLGGFASFTDFGAISCSGDGSVIVGDAWGAGSGTFIWTQATGMQDLSLYLQSHGANLGIDSIINVNAVSADGTVFSGNARGYMDRYNFGWVAYQAAPEPSSIAVLALGALLTFSQRKKQSGKKSLLRTIPSQTA